MTRLTCEGLSRHDALHAIGSVLAKQVYELLSTKDENAKASVEARYNAAVERLTARKWKRGYGLKRHGG